jgi:NTE family protein
MRKRKLCLALQGGGAHGAFTWGVLDRLLEEESLEIEAVSGTSAGAINGAILVDALKHGGANHARERLQRLWRSISAAGNDVFKPGRALAPGVAAVTGWSPLELWTEAVSLVWSPYDNPFYRNALADVLAIQLPDCSALNDQRTPFLFACATNVRTTRRKIFGPGEFDINALTASACLPTLFRSIEIDGEFYWDGGYLGNPALYPLRSPALASDIEAIDAINELKTNADDAHSPYKLVHLHEIKDEPHLAGLHYTSKFDTDWAFLLKLRDYGRAAAQRWLETCLGLLGRRSTADMHAMLRCLESE